MNKCGKNSNGQADVIYQTENRQMEKQSICVDGQTYQQTKRNNQNNKPTKLSIQRWSDISTQQTSWLITNNISLIIKHNSPCLCMLRYFSMVFTKCLAHHWWWIGCSCFPNLPDEAETDHSWVRWRQSISNTAGVLANPKTPKWKAIKSRRLLVFSAVRQEYQKLKWGWTRLNQRPEESRFYVSVGGLMLCVSLVA